MVKSKEEEAAEDKAEKKKEKVKKEEKVAAIYDAGTKAGEKKDITVGCQTYYVRVKYY